MQPFDSFPKLLNWWPPTPPPQMPPGVLRGDLYLAYVHSQINPQTWTKDGANRSRLLTVSQTFECLTPKTPPSTPLVSWGAICLAYIHFQMDLQMCVKFGANRSSCLTASPDLWICDTLTLPQMPPGVLRGDLYLAYVHSQMNPQTWTKVGAHRTASPDFWIVDPLKKTQVTPLEFRGAICLMYIHSHMNLHMCAKFGANQPSRLVAFPEFVLRLVRLYALTRAKTRQKLHLYINNYNCGLNMLRSTSLSFFTAIFLAFSHFSGTLAEELMILCCSVTTELYI